MRTPPDEPVRRLRTDELAPRELHAVRAMLEAAFGDVDDERLTEEDWLHALGGTHFLVERDGAVLAHAAVVAREIHVGDRALRTGYVEAVATAPAHQRRGLGTRVMRDVGDFVRDHFELGALGTGLHAFYERLGWTTWRGPSFVRTAAGDCATPEEDGYILVLATRSTPPLDPTSPIRCDARSGDAW